MNFFFKVGPIRPKKFHPKNIIACRDNNNLPKINKSWRKIFAPAPRPSPSEKVLSSLKMVLRSYFIKVAFLYHKTNLDGVVDDSFAVAVVAAAVVVVVA